MGLKRSVKGRFVWRRISVDEPKEWRELGDSFYNLKQKKMTTEINERIMMR